MTANVLMESISYENRLNISNHQQNKRMPNYKYECGVSLATVMWSRDSGSFARLRCLTKRPHLTPVKASSQNTVVMCIFC